MGSDKKMSELPDWMYQQSAVIPYRKQGNDLQLMLVTISIGAGWTLPKGSIEPDLTSTASAEKEAWEEAGIQGKVSEQSLGGYKYTKWVGTFTVEVFPMRVTAELDEWPESKVRRREWMSVEASLKRLKGKELQNIVRRLANAIR